MKKISILNILLFVGLILAGFVSTSCDDDDEAGSGEVVLLSFGPSGVQHGDKIRFIGENLNKVTAIALPGIEVPAAQFTSQNSSVIELTVPAEAEEGRVMLKTPEGDVESKSILSFEVPVTVESFSPTTAKPGTTITITGEHVNWIRTVVFADGVATDEFVSKSLNEVVVTVPMEAQTGSLTFFTGGTEPLEIDSDEELVVTLPTITSVLPASVKHEDELTITGTDLDLVTEVSFAGNASTSTFVSQTETEIVLQVPTGAEKGKVTLIQASPVTVSSAGEITIILPVGTNLAPKPATPGQTDITITGTNLDLIASLSFVGEESPVVVEKADFKNHTPTQIVVTLPEDAIAGSVTYTTIHGYSKNLGVSVTIPSEGPPPLDYYIFDDQFRNGWAEWGGWEVTEDFASAEEVFWGTKAIKATYSGTWGAVQIGAPATPGIFDEYTTFTFRIYAPAAQDFIFQIGNNGDKYLSVPQGWSLVEIPTAEIAGHDNVTEIRFKNNNANTPVTLYLDEIGLKN